MYYIKTEDDRIRFVLDFETIKPYRRSRLTSEYFVSMVNPWPIYQDEDVTDSELEDFYELIGLKKVFVIEKDQDLIKEIFKKG